MDFEWELGPSARVTRHPGRPLLSATVDQTPTTPTTVPPTATAASSVTPGALVPSVPVPLITVGKVFAPIPPGRPLVRPEAVEAARVLGLAPMLAAALAGAPSDMDEFWDVAALTDPMMASNIMQSAVIGRRRVLFVERGAAAALARGQRELAPTRRRGDWLAWTRALNPIAALEGVCAAIERRLTKEAATAAAAAVTAARTGAVTGRQGGPEVYRMKAVRDWKKRAMAAASGGSGSGDVSSCSPLGSDFFGNTDSVRATASLAHIPVRIALNLLRGAPEKFLLLAGLHQKGKGSGGTRGKGTSETSSSPAAAALPDEFMGAESLDALQIHRIPGFEFVLRAPGGAVRLSPAFLSEAALHRFWSQGTSLYTSGVLLHRRMQRRALCQRLRVAAALVAGGGGGGGSIGIASSQNDDEEGMEEPPEVQEFVQELARDLAGGEGGSAPASGLVRAGATLATGVLTLLGPVVEGVGSAIDRAFVACGGGGLLLGFPRRPPAEAAPLGPFLRSMASFNASQAVEKSSKDAAEALALSAVCLGVAAKLISDEVGGAAPGSTGFSQLMATMRAVEKGGPLTSALLDGRGHWALAAALVAAAAAQARSDGLDAQVASVLRSVLPSLEYNGFAWALPLNAGGAAPGEAAAEAVRRLLLRNGQISLHAELDLGGNFACVGMGEPVNPRGKARQNGGTAVPPEAELGRGLLLIGDLGTVQGLRTPRGLSLDGVGVAVGVDDGRKYM